MLFLLKYEEGLSFGSIPFFMFFLIYYVLY
jgi:hypothetical protein